MGAGNSSLAYHKIVNELVEGPAIPPSQKEFWSQFWSAPSSVDDVFAGITASDLRNLKDKSPQNLSVLIRVVVDELERVARDPKPGKDEDFSSILNCMRLLTRVMPCVFEEEGNDFADHLFWSPTQTVSPPEDDREGDSEVSVEPQQQPKEDLLATRLLRALLTLLYKPGFTLHPRAHIVSKKGGMPAQNLWAPGIGAKNIHPSSSRIETNRVEALRCLLVCLSSPLYETQADSKTSTNKWLDTFAGFANFYSKGFFFSLMNVVCSYDPVGWGVPYNHYIFSDYKEGLADLALHVLLVLLNYQSNKRIHVQTRQPPASPSQPGGNEASSSGASENAVSPDASETSSIPDTPAVSSLPSTSSKKNTATEASPSVAESRLPLYGPVPQLGAASNKQEAKLERLPNVFARYLSELEAKEEFQFIIEAIHRLTNNPIVANNTWMPGSTKSIGCQKELLMLFWKFLHGNSAFLRFCLLSPELLLPIVSTSLHYMHEGRKDPAQIGLIHLGVFILLLLSGERTFGVILNRPVGNIKITIDIPKPVTYADFVVLVCYKLLVDGHRQLETLYECILTVFSNISPYIKALGLTASLKLLKLFSALSKPKFILSDPRHHRYLTFMLETFNNLIQYQKEGNYRLVYTIILHRHLFKELASLQLPTDSDAPGSPEASPLGASPLEASGTSASELPAKADSPLPEVADPSDTTTSPRQPQTPHSTPLVVTPLQPFRPTQEWLRSWQPHLPLGTILRLIDALMPNIHEVVGKDATETAVLEYLQSTTLVGLLPVPHPILIRRYQQTNATNHWFNTYLWGIIYLRNSNPPLFFGTNIKLFVVKLGD